MTAEFLSKLGIEDAKYATGEIGLIFEFMIAL